MAWIAAVIGGPLLGYASLVADPKNPGPTLILMLLCTILHFVTSIGLARRIASKRPQESRTAAQVGIALGLLIGGWAVMGGLFVAGCASELKIDVR